MLEARWVLHADMDAFYASIEQRERPELAGLPVIVGAQSARGVVAAASYEARRFGVRSAMPGFRARELCPEGVFLAPNMELYARVSAQVHNVFNEFTPIIEPIAFDEAFLDITASVSLFGSPRQLAETLKERVLAQTQLKVSVGIGPNKLVAKIACTLDKPDGLRVVTQGEEAALLAPLPVRRLWGVGPVLADKLKALNIETIGDLTRVDSERLRGVVGDRAEELKALARGQDERPVEADRAPKSYGEENTFELDLRDRERINATLTAHAEAVARRLRHDGYMGRTVTLKVKLARARGQRIARGAGEGMEPNYPILTRSLTLTEPTDDGMRIRDVALRLWEDARIEEPIRLLGVSASNLESKSAYRERSRQSPQLELFPSERPVADSTRPEVGPTLDAIQGRFGKDAIRRAVEAPNKITPSLSSKRGE